MKHEIEVKLRLPVSAILEALTNAGLPYRLVEARHFEDNWLLGGQDRKVPGKRAVLRVRKVNGAGTITYKAEPPANEQNSAFKIRTEIETLITDPEAALAIFRELGYQPWFRYQKFRTVFEVITPDKQTLEIMADETPLGEFVELEGTEAAISSIVRLLGVQPSDYILESYLSLQLEACRTKGSELEDMIFPPGAVDLLTDTGRSHQ